MTIGRLYPRFQQSLLSGEINVLTHTFRGFLLASGYTVDWDNHRYQSSLTNELSTANGYTAGGQALTSVVLAYDAATDTAWVDANDLVWDPSSITARYCAIVDTQSGSAATNPLVGLIDFEANKTTDNGPFRVQLNALGLIRQQAAA